ncbi:MAG TPA: PAS domain S-box protein, partial [Methanomicrobiales archaeon]|nr:PAS domain S-box protein [Methanomicrobiales archaeon]
VPFTGFIHPEDRATVLERYSRRVAGEDIPADYDFRFVGDQGLVTWVHLSAVRITWNGRPATLNFLIDVNERRKMEQEIRESEEMFRNPVERSPVGVFLIQDGLAKYINPKLAEMAGYSREEMLNRPFDLSIHPDDVDRVKAEVDRLLRGETTSAHIEYRGRGKDGSVGMVEAYGSSMLVEGRPAVYGTIVDVTDRKELENRIRESLQEKEVLLKEIHHRVKNNMQVISSLLSVQAQNIRDPEVRGLFNESQNRIRSIALVHELLYRSDNLDQIEYGAYLKKMFLPLFESYSIDQRKVSMAIDAKDVMITIEKAVPCSLIVNELISNSLKHAFPGDRRGEIRIGFRLDAEGGRYLLDYRDDGVGVPPGFDVKAATTLGMRLVHGLTRQLQGTVEHLPGEGVHFSIAFPAKKSQGGPGVVP